MAVVVSEGQFALYSLLQRLGSPVTGTGIVRLIRDPDGSHRLRISNLSIQNARAVPLRIMLFRAGPPGASRKPKNAIVDSMADGIWLDVAMNGALDLYFLMSILLCVS